MSEQDEQIRILNAGQGRSLVDRLAEAEAALSDFAEQARAAYQIYRDLDALVGVKAAEIKELRLQIREEAARRAH